MANRNHYGRGAKCLLQLFGDGYDRLAVVIVGNDNIEPIDAIAESRA